MLFLNFFYNSAQCETEQGGKEAKNSRIQEFKKSRHAETCPSRLNCIFQSRRIRGRGLLVRLRSRFDDPALSEED
jgi:hypothetical protein